MRIGLIMLAGLLLVFAVFASGQIVQPIWPFLVEHNPNGTHNFGKMDAKLAAFIGLSPGADKISYFTGSTAMSLTTMTSFARTLLDDASAADMRTTLGVQESMHDAATLSADAQKLLTITDQEIGVTGNKQAQKVWMTDANAMPDWRDVPGVAWGDVTGDLADQKDLQEELETLAGEIEDIDEELLNKLDADPNYIKTQIHFDIDGGGSAITTGAKAWVRVPYTMTILAWEITADVSGSIVVDVWKDTYANFPPTVADTIAGSEKPTLDGAQTNQDSNLQTWTTLVNEGDYIRINVDSAATVTKVCVDIYGMRGK